MAKQLGIAGQAGVAVATYIGAEIVLLAAAWLWVLIYSLLIYSAGDEAYYQAYAQVSSPIVAIVLAGPVFFVAGRALTRWFAAQSRRLALAAAALNIVVAVPLTLSVVATDMAAQLAAVCAATAAMFVGAWLGTRAQAL